MNAELKKIIMSQNEEINLRPLLKKIKNLQKIHLSLLDEFRSHYKKKRELNLESRSIAKDFKAVTLNKKKQYI